jgi:hypothetical protein
VDISHHFMQREESVSIQWDDAFKFEDKAWFRAMHHCEPTDILNVQDKLIANHKFYDLIMTWDDRVLNSCPNAKFLTESCCSWLPRIVGNPQSHFIPSEHPNTVVKYDAPDTSAKRFEVSFLTSSKGWAVGHQLRQEIYDRLSTALSTPAGTLPIWKHRSPPRIDDKRVILEPVQFSIVPENSRHNGYYTEKIVDCFIAKTIPIYWGCPSIGKHFNLDGIIQFENYDDLVVKLQSLTPDFYHDREPAIEENFRRALQGTPQWTLIENYLTEGIAEKHRRG